MDGDDPGFVPDDAASDIDPTWLLVRNEILASQTWLDHASSGDGARKQRKCDGAGCASVVVDDVLRVKYSARVLPPAAREARLFLYFDNHEGVGAAKSPAKMSFRLRTECGVVDVCTAMWCLAHDVSTRNLNNLRKKNRAGGLTPAQHGLCGRRSNSGVKDAQKDEVRDYIRELGAKYGVAGTDPATGRPCCVLPKEWTYAHAHRTYVEHVKKKLGMPAGDGGGVGSGSGDAAAVAAVPGGPSSSPSTAVAPPVASPAPPSLAASQTAVTAASEEDVGGGAAAGSAAAVGGQVEGEDVSGDGGGRHKRKHQRHPWVSPNAFKALWIELYVAVWGMVVKSGWVLHVFVTVVLVVCSCSDICFRRPGLGDRPTQ